MLLYVGKVQDKVQESVSEKEYYRQKIIEMVGKVENARILRCIYVFVSDIMSEIKQDLRKEEK